MSSAATPDDLTPRLLDALKQLVSQRKFDLWFSGLRVVSHRAENLDLAVQNSFHHDWIRTYYMDVLQRAVVEVVGEEQPFQLSVEDPQPESVPSAVQSAPVPTAPLPDPVADIRSRNTSYFQQNSDVMLNQKYTFDNFVVGPSNQLAHAASMAVAEAPAGSYNPLFLYGAVGLGKTHLLQAICHKAMDSGRALKVLYLSSETFVNQFIAAIEQGDLSRFRYKYRSVDLLLIDDIHLLANKERTQDEFFHTFNTLYNDGRQIVLSSDSPPSEIPTLRERLISRFKWGLVAEIATPGYETRQAILRRKARDRAIALPEEVLDFLAEKISRNIRELEGAVTKVLGYSQLTGRTIDLDLAREALGHSGDDSLRGVMGVDRIVDVVCKHYGVRIADLNGRRRTQSIVLPRQVAMFLTRKLTPLSLTEIGARFGGRDHSTVLYAVSKIEERMSSAAKFAQLITDFEARLQR
jgi:chromosomal replication initiator protein